MKLSELNKYNEIVIQMHDNPDADAIGSGYALYQYFKKHKKNVRLVYGGRYEISKSNIKMLVEKLSIPVEYVKRLNNPELLLTVDCQYGEGNVKKFKAQNIAMIDHHNTGRESGEMTEIRSYIASCSTIIYDMLLKEGYNINKKKDVATALYYGLLMDSNNFSEVSHPLERDMMEDLVYDKGLIKRLMYSNFTISELETAGIALVRYGYDENKRISIIKSKPCDPNILGLIGDLVLQVDSIDVSIIYNECPGGYKISVRSCVIEVAANDLAKYMTEGIGNGGGHLDKAGGFISHTQYEKKYKDLGIESYFLSRMNKYYDSYEVVYSSEGVDTNGFELYEKEKCTLGYVKTTDVVPNGTECKVRTLEGDVFIKANDDIFLMIGYVGEVYPVEREVLEKNYEITDKKYQFKAEYIPTLRDTQTDEVHDYIKYARQCFAKEKARIYAKELEKPAKVFTKWDYEKYMMGEIGDYLVHPENDDYDIYVVNANIFKNIYKKIK